MASTRPRKGSRVTPTRAERPEELEQLVPTLEVSSRSELEGRRTGIIARAPSGVVYRIRQINFERHALAGGLPGSLLQYVLEGKEGMKQLFEDIAEQQASPEEVSEEHRPLLEYLDRVVLASVIEPELRPEDLGTPGKIDEDAVLPPSDYQWLVSVAMRAEDYDAEGRRLWGVEPLSRFLLFRFFHGCAEDCESCLGVQASVAVDRG